ncbi:MAG TPA: hypothetical protein VEQ42_07325 [Pyrinomonadaceae bacterium]|nr:hypothetical protein [Pyrinomonadaceae bacterium]
MKLKIFVVLVAAALAWMVGRGGVRVSTRAEHGATPANAREALAAAADDGEGRDEIRQTYKLAAGARVEVRGINGPVRVEAVDSDSAEVHVVRRARDRADLERHKIIIENTPDEGLVVRGEKIDGPEWWKLWSGGEVRTEVTMKVPRRAEVKAKGINGSVSLGEFDGAVRVSGVNGRVEIGRSVGTAEVSGVNGGVTLGVARLTGDGLTVKGVNGGVKIRVADNLNADLEVKGMNGSIDVNVPNVKEEERGRSSLRARIGSGGPMITVKGVNGGLRLEPATSAGGDR